MQCELPAPSMKTLLDKQRQPAAMVDMCMRKYDGVDGIGGKWHFPILLFRFLAAALKHAAIQQKSGAARFQFVL